MFPTFKQANNTLSTSLFLNIKKARPKKELFNIVNNRFLFTYLLIPSIQLIAKIFDISNIPSS